MPKPPTLAREMDERKYGSWLVLGLTVVARKDGLRIRNATRVLCRCVCGKSRVVDPSAIRRGRHRNCGCGGHPVGNPAAEIARIIGAAPSQVRPVVWAPGYWVTACGRLFSVRIERGHGWSARRGPGPIRELAVVRRPRRGVCLSVRGQGLRVRVSQLVAQAFRPLPPWPVRQVRYRDGDPTNDRAENLYYVGWGNDSEPV